MSAQTPAMAASFPDREAPARFANMARQGVLRLESARGRKMDKRRTFDPSGSGRMELGPGKRIFHVLRRAIDRDVESVSAVRREQVNAEEDASPHVRPMARGSDDDKKGRLVANIQISEQMQAVGISSDIAIEDAKTIVLHEVWHGEQFTNPDAQKMAGSLARGAALEMLRAIAWAEVAMAFAPEAEYVHAVDGLAERLAAWRAAEASAQKPAAASPHSEKVKTRVLGAKT